VIDDTDQIIAHVELLRAVELLLVQAEVVRQKRATLLDSFARSATRPLKTTPLDSTPRRKGVRSGK
jgi:hypothetical protein